MMAELEATDGAAGGDHFGHSVTMDGGLLGQDVTTAVRIPTSGAKGDPTVIG